jgi:hypothetical protein
VTSTRTGAPGRTHGACSGSRAKPSMQTRIRTNGWTMTGAQVRGNETFHRTARCEQDTHTSDRPSTMSLTKSTEQRALTTAAWEAAALSRYPTLCELDQNQLVKRRVRVREMQNKDRDRLSEQCREMRGKAERRGAQATSDDGGSKLKWRVLSGALKRFNKEVERRQSGARVRSQSNLAQKALAMKRARRNYLIIPNPDGQSRKAYVRSRTQTSRSLKRSMPRVTDRCLSAHGRSDDVLLERHRSWHRCLHAGGCESVMSKAPSTMGAGDLSGSYGSEESALWPQP